jgi:hypothetical protein
MKFIYWMLFSVFFWSSLVLNLNEVVAAPKYGYTALTSKGKKAKVKTIPKKILIKVPFKEETNESVLKVLVIKKTEIKSLVDSIEKNYKSYINLNRHERIGKVSSDTYQNKLKIKLEENNEQTINLTDKPLTLGGKGFGMSGFEPVAQNLHFSFDSHIKESLPYEVKKENAIGYLDSKFKKTQSEKFLIFHNSGSIFGREPVVVLDSKPKQFAKQREGAIEKFEPIPETGVYFDQNKKVIVHLNPAEKPLDLIHDNAALLKHDYQTLISDGP